MESNKSEALRSIKLAKAALESNDKERALKLINIAKRLDPSLSVGGLLSACENLGKSKSQSRDGGVREVPTCSNESELPHCGRNYTEENVKLITEIKRCKDYYGILGVEKSCSVEEIRKAYKKLSLKVHPDKNKAPGADEAFKSVSKAFKCLSEEETRRQYDQTGFVEGHEYEQQYGNVRRRRRRRTARSEFYDENFDPDEIFRSFFYGTQGDVFRAQRAYRAREMAGRQREHNVQRTHTYQILKVTENHGVEYYVKLADFDEKFPPGSSVRNKIENDVVRDYKGILGRYCHLEMQRRQWVRDYPTPHCNKLRSFLAA